MKQLHIVSISTALALSTLLPLNVNAQEEPQTQESQYQRGRMSGEQTEGTKEQQEARKIISSSSDTFKQVTDKANVPEEVKKNAKCVLIFPEVTKAGLVIGGQRGSGVATCRNEQDQWSQVAFVTLTGGSLGAQIGASQSGMVMFLQNEQAVQNLQKGRVEFGGDLNAVIGSRDIGVGGAVGKADVVALTQEEGAYAGATLSGVQVALDKERINAFYPEMEPEQILSQFNREPEQEVAKNLLQDLKEELEQPQS